MDFVDKIKDHMPETRDWQRRPEILLHPNIPKPMHGLAPRNILGSVWWNQVRKEAYASTNQHCIACGVHRTAAQFQKHLEGHEIYDISYQKCRMVYLETVPLCNACHSYIHDGRLRYLLDKKAITQKRFASIIYHGDRVLKEAGLERPSYQERAEINSNITKWNKWRLDLFGTLHKPLYDSYHDWQHNIINRDLRDER